MLSSKEFPKIMRLTLSQAHSLIIPHIPKGVDFTELTNKIKDKGEDKTESFGLFGDSPNYNTFYPNITSEDWIPKESDFIEPGFRLFSETIVVKGGVPIDFSTPGVLQNSMDLLKGVTVNADHQFTSVGNSLGSVKEVSWQDPYKIGDLTVPAGINGKLLLDAKSNPRIARGILMDPPSIHSTSVTVSFKWEKSHPQLEDFWDKVGSYDKEQNLIRLIVSEIVSYVETSLVYRGADVFAQKLDTTGKIVNPKYAKAIYAFSSDESCKDLKCSLDFKYLSQIKNEYEFSNNKNKNNMELTELLTTLGLSDAGISSMEELVAYFSKLAEDSEALSNLSKVKKDITPESLQEILDNQIPEGKSLMTEEISNSIKKINEALKDGETVEELISRSEAGLAYLEMVRTSAISNYKLAMGESDSDQAVIDSIKGSSLAQAKSLETLYSSLVEKTIPLTCKDCGSTNVSRASHSSSSNKSSGKKSFKEELAEASKRHTRKPSDIHKK